ncbi:unnamed protein product [Orchesella dallaii]|uniref:Uncharacterized protein n=1 Tax=Orchesella dallaii TaxID=48710 RepID=A0ABP1RTJ5_9HEXA
MESQNKLETFIIDSATDQQPADLTVCEIQPEQKAAVVSGKDGDDLDVSIEEGNITPIVYIDEACPNGANTEDGQLPPCDCLLSLSNSDFQILATNSLVVKTYPQQRDDVEYTMPSVRL